jgi:hypothetical protein
MTAEKIITGLTPSQADGLACVVCGADYLRVHVHHVPVGRSVTGSQVFVCVGCRLADEHHDVCGSTELFAVGAVRLHRTVGQPEQHIRRRELGTPRPGFPQRATGPQQR